jgi:Flp pilus assembly protein TadB
MTFDGSTILSSTLLGLAAAFGARPAMAFVDQRNRRFTADLRQRMDELGLATASLDVILRWAWTGIIATFLFVWIVLRMPPLACVAAIVMYSLIRPAVGVWAKRRQTLLRDQLVGVARALGNQVRAGVALPQGFAAAARQAPEPLGSELRKSVAEYQRGAPLSQVLVDLKNRLRFESMTLLCTALAVCHERGGNLSFALDQIGYSLEEQQRVERKMDSDTASGQMLVSLMGVFPVAFLGMFYMLDAESTTLMFSTFLGQLVLCVVAGIVYASMRWAGAILAQND